MKKFLPLILLAADPVAGGATPDVKPETAEQKVARLQAELDGYKAEKTARQEVEAGIVKKMQQGLTREQAQAVIARQKSHDTAQEEFWAKRRATVIKVLKDNPDDEITARRTLSKLFNGYVGVEEIEAAKKASAAKK